MQPQPDGVELISLSFPLDSQHLKRLIDRPCSVGLVENDVRLPLLQHDCALAPRASKEIGFYIGDTTVLRKLFQTVRNWYRKIIEFLKGVRFPGSNFLSKLVIELFGNRNHRHILRQENDP